LNNLEDKDGRLSTFKALNITHPQYSIYDNANYGPTFGAGADLHIPDKCNSNKGYTKTPYSYKGLTETTLFGNKDNWTVTDMEIYKVVDSPFNIYKQSTIISSKHESAVNTLLPKKSFSLLYRASVDGYSAAAFHSRCNGKAPLWFVIKANTGFIATVYVTVAFTSANNYVTAPSGSSWLNNLEDNGGNIRTSKALNTTYPQYTIYDGEGYGPTFGGGHDLHIPNDCNKNTGYTNIHSYAGFGNTTLFGNYSSWTVAEMEIYSVS
jgi:hypothetical protein